MALQPILEEIMNGRAAAPMHMRTTQRIFKQWQHLWTCAFLGKLLKNVWIHFNVSDGAVTHSWWDHKREYSSTYAHAHYSKNSSAMAPRTRMRVAYKNLWEMFAMPIYRFLGLPLEILKYHVVCNKSLVCPWARSWWCLDLFFRIDYVSSFYDNDVSYAKVDVFTIIFYRFRIMSQLHAAPSK